MLGRRLAATALDAVFLLAPWTAYAGLMAFHGVWGGQLGGLGEAIEVVIGAVAGNTLLLVLEVVVWLAAGRTLGMGLVRIAVVHGRPWLASIVVVSLTFFLGGGTTVAAIGAGSVDPQNAAAIVLLAAKALDLAFAMGGSGRTLVDRLSGTHVGAPTPSPRRRVAGGLTIDAVLALAVGAPLVIALTDLDHLAGAALGTGVSLVALLAVQAVTLATTRETLGMRVLA